MAKYPASVNKSIDGVVRKSVPKDPKKRLNRGNIFLTALLLILIIIGLLMLVRSHHTQTTKQADTNDVSGVKTAVERHFILPTNEEPALATVTDVTKLNSSLRSKAQNGDRILIYQNNQIAIIYRPTVDRIAGIVPVSIDTPPSATKK